MQFYRILAVLPKEHTHLPVSYLLNFIHTHTQAQPLSDPEVGMGNRREIGLACHR